jgi:hypothetical protein
MTDDGLTHKIRISVKLGPVALVFAGTAKIDELDTTQKRALVKAQGSDTKGRGGASAAITFTLTPTDTGTRVDVVTDVALSGSVAQYGRGAGKFPPVDAMRTWVKRVLRVKGVREINSVAYLVGRKIAQNGTKAQLYNKKTVEQNQTMTETHMKAAAARVLRNPEGNKAATVSRKA